MNTVTLVLRRRNEAALKVHVAKLVARHKDHRPMTRHEFHAKHSATPTDLALVAAFASRHGLAVVETSPERRTVRLSGTHEQLAAAGITKGAPVPSELAKVVLAVLGTDDTPYTRRPLAIEGLRNGV